VCLILFLLFSIVGCDQATKVLARDTLSTQSLSYLGGLVRFQHVENPGAFMDFGAQSSPEIRFVAFTLAVGIFLLGALYLLLRRRDLNRWFTIALALLVAGGIGNLIDRAWRGSVTDFINLGVGWLRTGVFNIADMAVMAGVFLLALIWLKDSRVQKIDRSN